MRDVDELGVIECDASFLWWWTTGRPGLTWYHESPGSTRMVLTDIFGKARAGINNGEKYPLLYEMLDELVRIKR